MFNVQGVVVQSGVDPIVVGLVVGLVLGPLAYVHAENRGRNGVVWGAVCFLFGVIGLVVYGVVAFVDSKGGDDESPDGVRCDGCGDVNEDHANHCRSCGAALWEPCPDCGQSNAVVDDYCQACGARTTPAGGESEHPDPSTPRSGA